MKNFCLYSASLLCAIGLLTACSVSTKDTLLITQPLTSISETVESFIDGEERLKVNRIKQEAPQRLAILPLVNDTSEPNASKVLRQVINSHLSGLNFQLMHPAEVDQRLPQTALENAAMASYLGVDAVLVGRVTKFDRFFAGIYADIELAVVLELINTKGEVIWTAENSVVRRSGGLSSTPWGILLTAAIASLGLDEENVLAGADELARGIALAMPQPAGYQSLASRAIASVLHNGGNQALSYPNKVNVGIKGEPGMSASIELAGLGVFPVDEVEAGVYIGEIPVEPNWNAENVFVRGRLTDAQGNTSVMTSGAGLMTFDNMAPSPVTALSGELVKNRLRLNWQAVTDAVAYEVLERKEGTEQLLATTDENALTQEGKYPLFARQQFLVRAVDRAGNRSAPVAASLMSYPRPLGAVKVHQGALAGEYDGPILLTRAGSPYQVESAVTMRPGSSLYIEPGVELSFSPSGTLRVEGDLFVWGTFQKVRLSPFGESLRRLPYVTIASSGSLQIEGVTAINPAVAFEVLQGNVQMDVIEVIGSRFSAMTLSNEANVSVQDCLIDGSNTSAVVVSDFAKLAMTGCTFRNNSPFHIQNASGYEVSAIGNTWEPAASSTTLLGKVKLQ